jgi:hypothetical protein
MDVGLAHLGLATRTDRSHVLALSDGRALAYGERTEMGERDGMAVRGRDRDALARARNGARKRDHACGRRHDRRAGVSRDVDAPVLTGGIRMRRVEAEPLQNPAVARPRPCARGRHQHEGEEKGRGERSRGEARKELERMHRHWHHLRGLNVVV